MQTTVNENYLTVKERKIFKNEKILRKIKSHKRNLEKISFMALDFF